MEYLVKCYLCDSSAVLPLKLIFQNILETSIYPNVWKLANVTPVFKKDDKQLVTNYQPISLVCISILTPIWISTWWFHHKLLFIVNEMHEAFDDPKSLEVRAKWNLGKTVKSLWKLPAQ